MDAPVSPALRQRLLANDLEALIAQRLQRKAPLGFDDILPTLSIPCLLMVGEADAAYARVQDRSHLIPNVTFISFPNFGHTGSFLNRAEVVSHMQQFLRGLAGGWDENAAGTRGPTGNTPAPPFGCTAVSTACPAEQGCAQKQLWLQRDRLSERECIAELGGFLLQVLELALTETFVILSGTDVLV